MEKKLRRFESDDFYYIELLVDKLNELVDKVEEMEERLNRRIDNHWAYHRRKQEQEGRE